MRAKLDLRPFRHQGVVDALGDAERLEERRLAAYLARLPRVVRLARRVLLAFFDALAWCARVVKPERAPK